MKLIKTLALIILLTNLSACSNNKTASTSGKIANMQKVEMGTVVSVKTIALKPDSIESHGEIGVSIGSGGTSGVYGSVDIGTLGTLFSGTKKPTTAQQFIIKKSTGETVAITQEVTDGEPKEVFKAGDIVKLLLQNGKAKVIH